MNKNVLQYVQACLSTMDSDAVDSIADTEESSQVANLLADVYQEMMTRQDWAFLKGPVTLTAAGDVSSPTKFTIPDTLRYLTMLWYNVDEAGEQNNREIRYVEPEEFLLRTGNSGAGKQLVSVGTSVKFYVQTDRHPTVYTSFDDKTIYMDSFKQSVNSTLIQSKVTALGFSNPVFVVSDTHVPFLPDHMVPLLQHTLNAAAHLHFKQQASAVDEKRVIRQTAAARRKDSKLTRKHYYANQYGRR